MGVLTKLRWLGIGANLWMLKRLLAYRIKGNGAKWLQSLPIEEVSIVNREDFLLSLCNNKKVWHLGFTDYPFTASKLAAGELLHQRIKGVAAQVVGVDNNATAILTYQEITHDTNTLVSDITEPFAPIASDTDLLLLGEVLEHIKNPHQAIQHIYAAASGGMQLVVTVPNYLGIDSLAASTANAESIHPHHYWYFSPYTLQQLFPAEQFTCSKMLFGTYDSSGKQPNVVRRNYPFFGDCIIAIFTLKK